MQWPLYAGQTTSANNKWILLRLTAKPECSHQGAPWGRRAQLNEADEAEEPRRNELIPTRTLRLSAVPLCDFIFQCNWPQYTPLQ